MAVSMPVCGIAAAHSMAIRRGQDRQSEGKAGKEVQMTPDEINRAIAESVNAADPHWECPRCGRVEPSHVSYQELHDLDCCLRPVDWIETPNYHGDLNAIQEAVAESFTSNESLDAFAENLAVVIFGSYPDALLRYSDAAMMVNATAPQRCEAYLKTIGKWRDQ
jgi:hypothetical protein